LNADDEFCPGALAAVQSYLLDHPNVDVVCGHAYVVDESGQMMRRVWSDPFNRRSQAYGCSIQIQPSTFIRERAFKCTSGFNVTNRSNWDGELLVDLALAGAKIQVIDEFLSLYRVHRSSITGSGALHELVKRYFLLRFEKIMGREWRFYDPAIAWYWFMARQVRNPKAMIERLRYGPVYRACV
jgi:hypothetical protein